MYLSGTIFINTDETRFILEQKLLFAVNIFKRTFVLDRQYFCLVDDVEQLLFKVSIITLNVPSSFQWCRDELSIHITM